MIYEKPLFHWVFERNRRRQVGLLTMVLATVFFICTLALAYFGNLRPASSGSVLEGAAVVAPAAVSEAPAVAAPASGAAQIPAK